MLGRGPSVSVEGSPWLAGVAERTALGRLGEAEDVAQVILAVHGLDWVTGQVIECDGGLALRSPIDSYGEAMRARAPRPPETRPDSLAPPSARCAPRGDYGLLRMNRPNS